MRMFYIYCYSDSNPSSGFVFDLHLESNLTSQAEHSLPLAIISLFRWAKSRTSDCVCQHPRGPI